MKFVNKIKKCSSLYLKVLFFLALLIGCQSKETETTEKVAKQSLQQPNVVYILADDMGYGDLSSLNPESGIQTPNMDRIVKNGIYFSDAHSNSAVCTPTRYGILTGRNAWKSRLKSGVLWGYGFPLIEEDRTTVASFLKEHGYHTACVGKWHLGLNWQKKNPNKPIKQLVWNEVLKEGEENNVDYTKSASGPKSLGFEYSYIIPASLDMAPYIYLENDVPTAIPTAYTKGKSEDKDGRGIIWRAGEMDPDFDFYNVLDHFTDKATDYITSQAETEAPFFLYFPLTAPHTPWLPTKEVQATTEAGDYGDFVKLVDNAVGKVMASLKKSEQLENTIVIVTSDNGAHWKPEDKERYAHRANHISRGQKADIYEGGHHVPYIAQWPGKIKAGSHSSQTISTTDLLATVAGIINKPVTKGAGEDSYNLWPAYIGQDTEPIRDFTIHHSLNGYFSIRKGKWKLTPKLGSGGFSEPKSIETKEGEVSSSLYNIEEDPKEENNVYDKYPEIVAALNSILMEQSQNHLK